MKTTFLTIATVLLMLTAAHNTFAATTPTTSPLTALPWITNFYKIEAHGNVEVHLISGDKNKVEMSNTYYDHNALVQVENGVLRVTCYCAERLQVWITVNDLRSLSAYDNVLVMSEGKFSSLDLDVELNNNARADMNVDCCFAQIRLNDQAKADIKGTAMEGDVSVNYAATLNTTDFIADQLSSHRILPEPHMHVEYVASGGGADIFNSAMEFVDLPVLQ